MKIETAGDLQKKFKAGMQIMFEDDEKNLVWVGKDAQCRNGWGIPDETRDAYDYETEN